jgi:hypothetical protein
MEFVIIQLRKFCAVVVTCFAFFLNRVHLCRDNMYYSIWLISQGTCAGITIACGMFVVSNLRSWPTKNRGQIMRFVLFIVITGVCVLGYIALAIYFNVAFITIASVFMAVEAMWVVFLFLQAFAMVALMLFGRSIRFVWTFC